jgi:tRNA threonylcarbamoyl adenosine modification protein (Sua5/YciO/YrdC/YwlC family)
MPAILNRDEFNVRKLRLLRELKRSVFIYPTDTIYGIGCNALDEPLVRRIRELKRRYDLPFSIIAPSKEWIRQHCVIDARGEEWLKRLPGPYTLILRLKDGNPLSDAVNMGLGTVGVRIPDHWFSLVVAELGFPVVTTSANLAGEDYMRSLDDLNPIIKKNVEHIFYEGELTGRPSTIVRLDKAEMEVRER